MYVCIYLSIYIKRERERERASCLLIAQMVGAFHPDYFWYLQGVHQVSFSCLGCSKL